MGGAIESTMAVGLSSGTSMDGVDAALVRLQGPGGEIELVAFSSYPYERELAAALRVAPSKNSASQLALLGALVGEAFADAALRLLEESGEEPSAVAAIGSHGQTIVHFPDPSPCAGTSARASLQIGDAAVIAERTGITTVSDFRARDIAAGGQGAPLVPLLDHRLYTDPNVGRVALNVGGIANVTGLPPGGALHDVVAFDTGPGNVLLDAAARLHGLPAGYDVDGALARSGRVDEGLLAELLGHPFFDREPPKSADTGDFLDEDVFRARHGELEPEDLLATLTELTARAVADAIERFVAPSQPVDEVLISGGGAHNLALVGRLGELLAPVSLRPVEEVVGIPGDAKEAVAFALLAVETLAGRAGNVPSATGAAGPRVLGSVTPAI